MIFKNIKKNEYRLEIGNRVISLYCSSHNFKDSISKYFNIPSSHKTPDILIKLKLLPHRNIIEIPNSLFLTKIPEKKGFNINNNLVKGIFDKEKRKGKLKIKYILTKGEFVRVFEQLLYQIYYTTTQYIKNESYLIHSSGVIKDKKGYLFIGASEKGKTTIANLSQKYHVLNDEINIIEVNINNKLELVGTPFNGFYKNKKKGKALLSTIFLLNQAKNHKIKKISKSDTIKIISKEIVPPIGLNDFITPKTYMKMLDIAEWITNKIPVYQLDFLPDDGFWNEIKNFNII